MTQRIARWAAVCSAMTFAVALGCAKDKDGGKGVSPDKVAKELPGPKGTEDKPDDQTRHEQQVENAKKAIPTIAADDTTNAAVKAPEGVDRKAMAADAVAIKAPAAKPAASGSKKVAETPTFIVTVDAPAGKSGQDGAVKVIVKPKKGWKLNLDFPTRLTVEPPSGVSVAKKTQKKADAVEFSEKKGATWSVSYKPSSAGNKQFSGDLRFAVCTDATCDPKRATIAFAVDVK